jgi:hypothetical protein
MLHTVYIYYENRHTMDMGFIYIKKKKKKRQQTKKKKQSISTPRKTTKYLQLQNIYKTPVRTLPSIDQTINQVLFPLVQVEVR